MFYGRDDELEELNRRYRTKGFQFIPVYGRRRVGKTALIDEFINMRLLSSIVLGVKNAPVMEFENILEVMHSRFGGERYIFVIDEYPYLVGATNPSRAYSTTSSRAIWIRRCSSSSRVHP